MNLRAQKYYNNENVKHLRGFMNDTSNRLLGWAIMRQLRVKSNSCRNKKISLECRDEYHLFNEEKRSFRRGWINQTIRSSTVAQAFLYKTSEELNTYVYVGDHGSYHGGGYVYEFRGHLSDLRSNLSELHKLGWIDKQTRAVFLQISLYNQNIQLFTSVTFLTEFLSTGGIHSQSRFEPMNFYGIC
jgi:polycystin 1L2